MNEDVVELMVRLLCGEASEPPVRGVVEIGDERFRVWKHGERLRVETPAGELRAIREPERLLTFSNRDEPPLESGSRSFAFADEDGSYMVLARPKLRDLELDERAMEGSLERSERFGRPTVALALAHAYHDDFVLRMVLDAATGMPFEMVEDGVTVMAWTELEVLDEANEDLWRWDGETRSAGWFAYVGSSGEAIDDGDIPDAAREELREGHRRSARLAEEFDRAPLVAQVPLDLEISSYAPGTVTIDLESRTFVTVRGAREPDPEDARGAVDTWTTDDGWTWIVHAHGNEDPRLIASLRERISTWRATRAPSDDE